MGGFIYHGSSLPAAIQGRYFFGDYVTDRLWSVRIPNSGGEAQAVNISAATEHTGAVQAGIGTSLVGVVSISPDANGEPVVVELDAGRLTRIVPSP